MCIHTHIYKIFRSQIVLFPFVVFFPSKLLIWNWLVRDWNQVRSGDKYKVAKCVGNNYV